MAMATLTYTQHSVNDTYAASLEQLSVILSEFTDSPEYTDPLSIRITRWAAGVFKLVAEQRFLPGRSSREEIERLAKEKIDILVRKILINPLTKAPFVDPVKERTWTWERWLHTEFHKYFSHSLLDDEIMVDEPPPHRLALAVISWVNGLTFLERSVALPSEGLKQDQVALVSACTHPVVQFLQQHTYRTLAKNAVIERELIHIQEKMSDTESRVNEFLVRAEALTLEVIQKAQADAAAHELALQEKVDVITQHHKDLLDGLTQQLAFERESSQVDKARLETEIAAMNQSNHVIADQLREQLRRREQESQATIAQLGRQIDQINRTQTTLLTKLDAQSQAHHSEMSAMSASHRQDYAAVQAQCARRLDEQDRVVAGARAEVAAAQAVTQQHAEEVEQMRRELQRSQNHVRALQEEVDDMDDSFCSIS